MALRCSLFGHSTIREFRKDAHGFDVLHLVCSRCDFAEVAIQRTRSERIAMLKKHKRPAAAKKNNVVTMRRIG